MFTLNMAMWSFAFYCAAWLSGGLHNTSGDFGFDQHGHLALPPLLMGAGVVTAFATLDQIWRRHRRAAQ